MKTSLLRHVLGTRADTKTSGTPAIPMYSAILASRKSAVPLPSATPKLSVPADTTFKQSPVYTGSAMLCVSTMHKSNAVPVFDADHIKEITRMRRG